ncbi:MAG TPA: TIGR03118 family protein [Vicinamibacterales bacterium]|nr:TIGR03118 family protein [Vicinamibacterales bacterium]
MQWGASKRMNGVRRATTLLSFAVLLSVARPAAAQFYLQHNLVSDLPGVADLQDGSLVNSWGLVSSTTSPFWVSNNGTGTSTLYNTSGSTGPAVVKVGLTHLACGCVMVPGDPTGVVFNGPPLTSGTGFVVSAGGASGPARFIFVSEDGSISGWNPGVPPPVPPPPLVSSQAIAVIPASDANVYKGVAIAATTKGDLLYATNFRAGTVDVFDGSWTKQPAAFSDPEIPVGFAPFGIQNIGGIIYVTYAKQDADKSDDVAGVGNGFVDAFTTDGTLIRRVASGETLNSPWGLAMAPAGFGKFSGDLLIGNFGDGRIQAFDVQHLRGNDRARFRGFLHGADGHQLRIDGLWALQFGNGAAAGPRTTLFFTAGPQEESHGLFGSLVATTPGQGHDD